MLKISNFYFSPRPIFHEGKYEFFLGEVFWNVLFFGNGIFKIKKLIIGQTCALKLPVIVL
jgi:hypothetical protein